MRFKERFLSLDLSPEGIDRASDWLTQNLEQIGIEKPDRLRARLLLEEALLNNASHFGDEQEAMLFLERSRGHFRLRLVVKGEPYNPLRLDDEQEEWTLSLFSIIEMQAQYSYGMGANVVRILLPRKSKNPALKILLALAIGALVGVLGNTLVPDPIQNMITAVVFDPLRDAWIRLLMAISGPVIFFTMFTAAFGAKRISDYGGSKFTTLMRYFAISAVVVIATMLVSYPFFPSAVAMSEVDLDVVSYVFAELLKIVPENLLEPFTTADTPKLLLMAVIAGYALASMGNRAQELKQIIRQINMLGLVIAEWTCSLVPYFVGLLLCLKIWTHDIALLGSIWKPFVVATVVSLLVVAVTLVVVAARMGMSPLLLASKLKGPFVDALKTGSLDYSSVDVLAASCKKLLGIDTEFSKAVLPQGLVLYMPTSAVGICVFVLFAARNQGIAIDQLWLIAAACLALVLAVATPPVNGANLLAFVVAFSYLGISSDAFLDVMVFDIAFGVLCVACDQAMLQLETILQAGHMGSLDAGVLCAPLAQK